MICDLCEGLTQIRITSTVEKRDKNGDFYNVMWGICPECVVREAKLQIFFVDSRKKWEAERKKEKE
jgi:hypothetical protein